MPFNLSPGQRADTYDWCGPIVQQLVRDTVSVEETEVLDVGPGFGKYRVLLPEYTMDACEVWEPSVVEHELRDMYRHVYVMDVCDLARSPEWHHYDLVIMGDVFEHVARKPARELLTTLLSTCDDVVVVVPYLYEQGEELGNPYQCHLQADLTPDLMTELYPELQLTHTEYRSDRPFKGIYRRRHDA
jgi:hypothetical protein